MATHANRTLDPEIMNLNGGLFQDMHLRGPIEWIVVEPIAAPVADPAAATAAAAPVVTVAASPAPVVTVAPSAAPVVMAAPEAAAKPARSTTPPGKQRRRVKAMGGMGIGAGLLLVVGLAAASQIAGGSPPSAPVALAAAMATSSPVRTAHNPPAVSLAAEPTAPEAAAPPPASPAEGQDESGKSAPGPRQALAGTSSTARSSAPNALDVFASPRQFSRSAAAIAIASAARGARGCTTADDPRTTMPVRVVYAPSGRVTSATVQGGPFIGTSTGACIAGALRSARISGFDGEPVAVTTTVRIR